MILCQKKKLGKIKKSFCPSIDTSVSGSPIIQNGKLIGALTHVIVDNPEKGYAIFAERMLKESENVE